MGKGGKLLLLLPLLLLAVAVDELAGPDPIVLCAVLELAGVKAERLMRQLSASCRLAL